MSKFESGLLGKLNTIADWILRMTVINILIIAFSLPIVTLYPAVFAGYKMLVKYKRGDGIPIFKGYFGYFKEDLSEKVKIGFGVLLVMILGFVGVTFYQNSLDQNPTLFNSLGYYMLIALIVGTIVVTLYTLPIMLIYPKTDSWLLVKLAVFLSGKFAIRTFLLVLTLIIPFIMLLHPLTLLVFVFSGVTIPLLIHVFISEKVVAYLESLGTHDD